MPILIQQTGEEITLALTESLTIRDAASIVDALKSQLASERPVRIDTHLLTDIDTCVLQLVCAFLRSSDGACWGRISPAFESAVDQAGLRYELFGRKGVAQ